MTANDTPHPHLPISDAALRSLAMRCLHEQWYWGDTRPPLDGGEFPSVPQCSYLGGTLIALSDTYEDSDLHCAYVAAANPQTVLALLDRLDAAEARAEAMREALAKYGRHSDNCTFWLDYHGDGGQCSCGLYAVLAQHPQRKDTP